MGEEKSLRVLRRISEIKCVYILTVRGTGKDQEEYRSMNVRQLFQSINHHIFKETIVF